MDVIFIFRCPHEDSLDYFGDARKRDPGSRNASTATSSAALNAQGYAPAYASLRAPNASKEIDVGNLFEIEMAQLCPVECQFLRCGPLWVG
jgi:hypothetical protein